MLLDVSNPETIQITLVLPKPESLEQEKKLGNLLIEVGCLESDYNEDQ